MSVRWKLNGEVFDHPERRGKVGFAQRGELMGAIESVTQIGQSWANERRQAEIDKAWGNHKRG